MKIYRINSIVEKINCHVKMLFHAFGFSPFYPVPTGTGTGKQMIQDYAKVGASKSLHTQIQTGLLKNVTFQTKRFIDFTAQSQVKINSPRSKIGSYNTLPFR